MIFFQIKFQQSLSWIEKRFIERLYKDESRRLWGTAWKKLDNKDFTEDVVQHTFEKAIKKVSLLRSFKSPEKVSAYVYIVTKNAAKDINRVESDTFPLETIENDIADIENIEQTVLNKLEVEKVKERLSEINPIYSDVFIMRYFLNMKYEDIAFSLSISVDNARKRTSKCRALLKEVWDE